MGALRRRGFELTAFNLVLRLVLSYHNATVLCVNFLCEPVYMCMNLSVCIGYARVYECVLDLLDC